MSDKLDGLNVCLMNDSFPPVIDGVATTILNYAEIINNGLGKATVVTPEYPGAKDDFRHLITPFHNTVYRNDSGLSITNATKISAAVCIITNKSGHGFKHPKAAL